MKRRTALLALPALLTGGCFAPSGAGEGTTAPTG